jgi:hypothetical protein
MDVSDEIVPLEESFQELDLSEQSHQPENEVKTHVVEILKCLFLCPS